MATVGWDDEVDDVIAGDLTAALAYITPAGGTVVTAVAPIGLRDRAAGTVGFTTSLGFGKKLERIVRQPRIALAYHAREHGFARRPSFVLVQGTAAVDLEPDRAKMDELTPQAERYLGPVKRGPIWDRLLREYYAERVLVTVTVERIAVWPDLECHGAAAVTGTPLPDPPPPQKPPGKGTGPRVPVGRAAHRMGRLDHRLLGYRQADGFPAIVPVALGIHGPEGIHVAAPPGLLPAGGRRAGLLAHSYRAHLVGLTTRTCTGWLDVDAGTGAAVYAPHTEKGFVAPPNKTVLLAGNGVLAKVGLWQARRKGTADALRAAAPSEL